MSRFAWTSSVAIAASTLGLLGIPAMGQVVHFRSGDAKLTVRDSAAKRTRGLLEAAAGGAGYLLIQFNGPVSQADRDALGKAGITLQEYLAPFAFFARVDRGAFDADAVGAVASVVAIEPIQRNWKLHPMIVDNQIPDYALSGPGKEADQLVAVYIQFHGDAPMGLAAFKTVTAAGGVVRGELRSMPVMVAEVPRPNLGTLADDDSVMWIEPALPAMEAVSVDAACAIMQGVGAAAMAFNDSNRPRVQADLLQAAPYLLDGTGVNVFVFDGGSALTTHQTFTAGGTQPTRITVIDGSAVAAHSTHCAGTIGGTGDGEAGNIHKGMAPNVKILSAALNTGGCANGASGPWFLYNCLTDLESDYTTAINHPTVPAAIASNSIGTNTSTNGFPCSLEGDYGITDALIDNIVRGSLGRPLRICWAGGNERQSASCLTNHNGVSFGGYYLTAPPATAKNHCTVGALNSNDDSMTTFSGWGPTDDGRMKPDISAPGCQVGGDSGVTSATSTGNASYAAMCGTSMACPTTAGVSALILQDFRANFGGTPDFRNSTLRILLAHTAQDLFNPGPDYQSGYGSIRAKQAVDFMRTGAFLENQVSQGQTFIRSIDVGGGSPLKVTIAWDDVAGTPNSSGAAALVNDLDLRLIDPNNVTYFPWTLDPANPSSNAVRTAPNHRDNIEQVVVDNPIGGVWRIEVFGFNVPSGPQPFSVAGVAPGSVVGFGVNPITVIPSQMTVGTNLTVDVAITATNQSTVPGSAVIFSRTSTSGAFTSQPLTFVSGTTYRTTLSAPTCSQTLQFYFSAQGSVSGIVTSPSSAPATVYTITPAPTGLFTRFDDNFQTDQGWTVTNTPAGGTFAGPWERGVPIASTGGPSTDADGSGQCFVTGLAANNDVDFGFTTLTSPVMDATGGDATLSYSRWFHRTSSTSTGGVWDQFLVEISNDGGTNWSTLEVIGQAAGLITGSWIPKSFPLPGATNQFRVRFTVNDNATNSTSVEGGLDAVKLIVTVCSDTPSCPADWDHSGTYDPADVAAYVNDWFNDLSNGTHVSDMDGDNVITPQDVSLFVQRWLTAVNTGSC